MTRIAAPAPRGSRRFAVPAGIVLLAAAVVVSLMVGSRALDPIRVLTALFDGGDAEAEAIVQGQRFARTLLGLLGGAALAAGGALIQGHTRNPLADPGLLGVTSGASLAVVVATVVFGLTTPAGYLWFAFAGAAAGAAAVLAIGAAAGRRREASPASLVLAGTAISALLSAATGVVLLLDASSLDVYRFWTVGSLAGGRGVDVVVSVGPLLLLGAVLAFAQAPVLDALELGDDTARALGRNLLRARLLGFAALTLLVGGATALVGSLGFVGLVAPHLARRLVGSRHRLLLPLSALLGAAAVLLADVAGRLVVPPGELPVGIVLGVIGGPLFVLAVLRLFRGAAA